MIAELDDMPPGTLGVRATGTLTAEDYRDVLIPQLRTAAQAGEIRLLFVISDFDKLELGALAEDFRVGITVGIGHRHAWKRTAVVTDVDWIVKSIHMFAWMMPGEVRVFGPDELDDAKRWVAD
jgi:hypothetical protein